ncbi:MAG: hypothetical protein CM1200mP30_22360 [Pseudomonadota bacterium]|nr:MAG: hypothetical protein CM1200mP30_22360 [Pseudomonadota bacterium]
MSLKRIKKREALLPRPGQIELLGSSQTSFFSAFIRKGEKTYAARVARGIVKVP